MRSGRLGRCVGGSQCLIVGLGSRESGLASDDVSQFLIGHEGDLLSSRVEDGRLVILRVLLVRDKSGRNCAIASEGAAGRLME